MAKIQLYIASSMDGFIASPGNDISWLTEFPNPDGLDYGYTAFYNGIDTVVMGRGTYEEVLGFDVEWPYANAKSYVLTSDVSYAPQTANTLVRHEVTAAWIDQLLRESNKNIWLVGGGQLVKAFLEHNAIDDIFWCIIPIVLGEGIPLFPDQTHQRSFKLIEAEAYSTGAAMLTYTKID